ncbi:hypothetical protein mRhiFer1_009740 [Rhinolophus ferrumequinum]|uniref:Uncharacterized protein n=1 Tax=Rhinolophus ferrumequinum TaxID=59479 RepID=A0A7J7ZCU8_RHIFE|nr:hypothetical protein mRhiFer1_009740 [Rhinolophus ferrumequinum]
MWQNKKAERDRTKKGNAERVVNLKEYLTLALKMKEKGNKPKNARGLLRLRMTTNLQPTRNQTLSPTMVQDPGGILLGNSRCELQFLHGLQRAAGRSRRVQDSLLICMPGMMLKMAGSLDSAATHEIKEALHTPS